MHLLGFTKLLIRICVFQSKSLEIGWADIKNTYALLEYFSLYTITISILGKSLIKKPTAEVKTGAMLKTKITELLRLQLTGSTEDLRKVWSKSKSTYE